MMFARRDAGVRGARRALIVRFLPLAESLARRYERSGEPIDDLMQVASLGLVKAVDRYDAGRGIAFSSFAVPTISGELKQYFRDYTWMVRPPGEMRELTVRVQHAITVLGRDGNGDPSVGRLAETVGVDEQEIRAALLARRARGAVSLQATLDSDGSQHTLQDAFGVVEEGFARAESQDAFDALICALSPRLRAVLRLRFLDDLTQAEIGEQLGVSQMHVSRLLRRALQCLRDDAEHEPTVAVARAA